jgi:hypothetical protein
LEKIEKNSIPSSVAVLREESIEAVRYALFDTTNWHRDYDPSSGEAEPPRSRSASVEGR